MANVHNVRIQYLYDTEENWISKDPQLSSNGEAYIFETPDGCGLKIGDGVHNILELEYTIEPQTDIIITEVPYVNQTYVYRGETIYPEFVGYNAAMLSISSDVSGKNAGTYSVTFTPRDGYVWFDGTKTAKAVTWEIKKAVGEVTLSKNVAILTYNNTAGNGTGDYIDIYTSADWSIGVGSCDNSDVFVEPHLIASPNWGININSMVLPATGSYTATVTLSGSQNYEDKTITFKVICIQDLDSCSWEMISEVSNSGLASNIFSIGDRKKIVLNGTVGNRTINNYECYVYIIGFNHNSELEGTGITFGTFKTITSDLQNFSLACNFNSTNTSGAKIYNINHWGRYNYGGWRGCDLRYDVLGSTNVAPSGYGSCVTTSRTGYDATATCAINPVNGTLMAALPLDLRQVMQPITKYTDGTGNSSNTASNVVATIDYLPLLSEYEVFGSRRLANQYEQDKQVQYAYYAMGNSAEKHYEGEIYPTVIQTKANWWLRSTASGTYTSWLAVPTSASNSSTAYVYYSFGIAPIFKV